MKSDDGNVVLAESQEVVDQLNAQFYGKFPFPWRPMKLDRLIDTQFQTRMFNQNLGDWTHQTLSARPQIWVAGCGTNQALITALNFPEAHVIGSDLSKQSLELGASTAAELGVKNLELRCESINQVSYDEEFDYILCTGVIMINADPAETLGHLARALKRTGVMELMVYNRYERLPTTAFQKAIRVLGANSGSPHFDLDLTRAKKIVGDVKLKHFTLHRGSVDEYPDCMLADLLILPVENSYTVESFEDLATRRGLEMLLPCCDMFDNPATTDPWNLSFSNPSLRVEYDSLPDTHRWQVTNHLLFERSPQLWFYFQRQDSGRPRKDEKQICEEFLETRFLKTSTTQRSFIRQGDGHYRLSPILFPYPVSQPKATVRAIASAADGQLAMREIFERFEIETSFRNVNQVRLLLTTSACPHLTAVQNTGQKSPSFGNFAQTLDNEKKKKLDKANFTKFKTIKARKISPQ
jgi:2-polyprenyl-3-methyl-5-hydroxy-6-metoxy-1,4-benzoquinol methylase